MNALLGGNKNSSHGGGSGSGGGHGPSPLGNLGGLASQFLGGSHGGSGGGSGGGHGSGSSGNLGGLASQFLGGSHGGSGGSGGNGGGKQSGAGKLVGQLASSFMNSASQEKPPAPQNYHGGANQQNSHHAQGGLAGAVMGGVAHMFGGKPGSSVSCRILECARRETNSLNPAGPELWLPQLGTAATAAGWWWWRFLLLRRGSHL